MRRTIGIILMLGIMLGIAQAEEAALKIPKIKIVSADADLGEMKKRGILDYNIEVKNTGEADLIIENVYSGCGCLQVTDERWAKKKDALGAEKGLSAAELVRLDNKALAAVTKVTIQPGRSIFISARLDTNKVSGEFERMLHIISNDPEKKDAIWKVAGKALGSSNGTGYSSRSSALR